MEHEQRMEMYEMVDCYGSIYHDPESATTVPAPERQCMIFSLPDANIPSQNHGRG